jgi:geranylgeranyl diphosphate synthase, type II
MQYQIQHLLPLVEAALSRIHFPQEPASLYDPIRYFMDLPGKRIRPVFALQCLELFREPTPTDADAALSTELFHNFSLVHDDIMDRAELRRGFPTVHIKWNEPTALLAGDALLVLAYDALLKANVPELAGLIHRFNAMALAVCEGQQLDMDFSTFEKVSLGQYQEMIDRKTAALIAFSFELGGFLGGAGTETRADLYGFGMAMGRCFQLRDDFLDLFGSEARTGKVRGGDIGNSKLTQPVLFSMAHAKGAAFQKLWNLNPETDLERTPVILAWMEANGIPAICEAKLKEEMEKGLELLARIPGRETARERIRELCTALAYREK